VALGVGVGVPVGSADATVGPVLVCAAWAMVTPAPPATIARPRAAEVAFLHMCCSEVMG
jgi:hypothetical protein